LDQLGGDYVSNSKNSLVPSCGRKRRPELCSMDHTAEGNSKVLKDRFLLTSTTWPRRKFQEGSWDDAKDSLSRDASTLASGGAIYCMCIEEQHPGILYIGFVLPTTRRTPRREFFSVMPDGFYFRHKVHPLSQPGLLSEPGICCCRTLVVMDPQCGWASVVEMQA